MKLSGRMSKIILAGVLVVAVAVILGVGLYLRSVKTEVASVAGLDGTYYIKNASTGKYLDVSELSDASGANIQQWDYTGGDIQKFKLVSDGKGYYSILTGVTGFTKAIDIENCGTNDDTNVIQWDYDGNDCQKFIFEQSGEGYIIKTKITGGTKALVVEDASTDNGANVYQSDALGNAWQCWYLESECSASGVTGSFVNPISIVQAADPFVQYINGYYYALYTEGYKITLYRSRSLDTVLMDEKKIIFGIGDEIQGNIWAPELHYIPSEDKWYVYASGSTSGDDFFSIRMFCIESEGSDPFGNYKFKGFTDDNILAIDQTVFCDESSGSIYTAFSEFTGDGQVITFATMDSPSKVSNSRICLSMPQYEWEKRGEVPNKDSRVNEGPIFLNHNGKLVLIYSASGCWSEWYCLGMLEYVGSDFTEGNMLNPENWIKHSEPIFSKGNDVYGVGHCSFFDSPDGSETWIAYHGMSYPNAGEAGRYMYVQPITFDDAGLPVIGSPIPRSQQIQLPSQH